MNYFILKIPFRPCVLIHKQWRQDMFKVNIDSRQVAAEMQSSAASFYALRVTALLIKA